MQPPAPPPPDLTLRFVRAVAPLAAAGLTVAIGVTLSNAPDGAVAGLLDNAWARVTIADLYLGLLASWVWIAWRERTPSRAVLWALLLLVTGSVALWSYVAVAARTARTVPELLLGVDDLRPGS